MAEEVGTLGGGKATGEAAEGVLECLDGSDCLGS